MPTEKEYHEVGLPLKVFLYSFDQIGAMLDVPVKTLEKAYIYYEGRTLAAHRPDLLRARNISPRDEVPEWRVADTELIRWLKNRGFKVLQRGWVKN